MDGSAYTSLGTLYHKLPGFPIAFGSDKKARMYLEKALQISPDAIDPNYFYGEFLYDDGEYARRAASTWKAHEGRRHARAVRSPTKGGTREIRALIAKTQKELS